MMRDTAGATSGGVAAELDRPRHPHDVEGDAPPPERPGGEARVLRAYPQRTALLAPAVARSPAARDRRIPRSGEAQPAGPETEVERDEEVCAGLEHVVEPADAQVGGPALDIQRHVWVLQEHEPRLRPARRDDQLARRREVLLGREAGAREPVQRRLQRATLRQ